jgi:uncharacterized protein YndB with AHSA1/START domain
MDPIVIEFELNTSVDHAFATWTENCTLWWPRSHTMSDADGFEVVFEPFVGGRIFERGGDGEEYEWGQVTEWDPPHRLAYQWHIFLQRDRATEVRVTFTAFEKGTTVRLENGGFEVFGDSAQDRQGRVGAAWTGIMQHYRDTV